MFDKMIRVRLALVSSIIGALLWALGGYVLCLMCLQVQGEDADRAVLAQWSEAIGVTAVRAAGVGALKGRAKENSVLNVLNCSLIAVISFLLSGCFLSGTLSWGVWHFVVAPYAKDPPKGDLVLSSLLSGILALAAIVSFVLSWLVFQAFKENRRKGI